MKITPESELERIKRACTTVREVLVVEPEEFGAVLRYIRRDKDITLDEMAEALGLTNGFLSLVERGERRLGEEHHVAWIRECMKRGKCPNEFPTGKKQTSRRVKG